MKKNKNKKKKAQKNEAFQLQSHTYMNDERVGVLIVGADEKVHQELSAVFLVQLGDDVLQPPRLAFGRERQRIEVEEEQRVLAPLPTAGEYFTKLGFPVVDGDGPLEHVRQHRQQRLPSSLLD